MQRSKFEFKIFIYLMGKFVAKKIPKKVHEIGCQSWKYVSSCLKIYLWWKDFRCKIFRALFTFEHVIFVHQTPTNYICQFKIWLLSSSMNLNPTKLVQNSLWIQNRIDKNSSHKKGSRLKNSDPKPTMKVLVQVILNKLEWWDIQYFISSHLTFWAGKQTFCQKCIMSRWNFIQMVMMMKCNKFLLP